MITNLKKTIWAIALLFSVGSVMVLSSCGDDDNPEPEQPIVVVPPGNFTYPATTVAVAAEGTVDPSTVDGSTLAFAITGVTDNDDNDASAAATFLSIDAATGVISVAKESTTGMYNVEVTATNSEGTGTGTAAVTIGINPDFDPTGMGYTWQYYMNQDDPWTMTGLNGIPELPIEEIEIPTGWPDGWPALDPNVWNEQTLLPYMILGGVADLLFQLPSDLACAALDPEEKGNTLYFEANEDFTLTTICELNDAAGSSVVIGDYAISWANDQFSWIVNLNSQIPITYVIDDPIAEQFIDPLEAGDGGAPPRIYNAIRGTVEEFLTPTDVSTETAILTSLTVKKVEVIIEVTEL